MSNIKMGCEYYTIKELRIYWVIPRGSYNIEYDNIELDRENGYYYFTYDEDNIDYDEKYKAYVDKVLSDTAPDIMIYKDDAFVNPRCASKYKGLVSDLLKKYSKTWADIKVILKSEHRIDGDAKTLT